MADTARPSLSLRHRPSKLVIESGDVGLHGEWARNPDRPVEVFGKKWAVSRIESIANDRDFRFTAELIELIAL